MSFHLFTILSALIVAASGNIFSPFSAFPPFSPFPSLPSFGSSFGTSSFPYSQPFGTSSFQPDDPFATAFSLASGSPFTSASFPSSTSTSSSSSLPFFAGGFSSSRFPFPPFPTAFTTFPSFDSYFTNGFGHNVNSHGLKGNGFKVSSSTTGGNDKNAGEVTIEVEKIGNENRPGERRRLVQTFHASGPLSQSVLFNNGLQNSFHHGQNKTRPGQAQKPNRLTTNNSNQQSLIASGNQKHKPSLGKPLRPTTTSITALNGSQNNKNLAQKQQSRAPAGNKHFLQQSNNGQLINNINSIGSKTPSLMTSSSINSTTNHQNVSLNANSTLTGSFNSKIIGNTTTINDNINSGQSANGITFKRVDSSGRIITGFSNP